MLFEQGMLCRINSGVAVTAKATDSRLAKPLQSQRVNGLSGQQAASVVTCQWPASDRSLLKSRQTYDKSPKWVTKTSSGKSPKGRKALNQVVVLKMDEGIPNSTEATNSRIILITD